MLRTSRLVGGTDGGCANGEKNNLGKGHIV